MNRFRFGRNETHSTFDSTADPRSMIRETTPKHCFLRLGNKLLDERAELIDRPALPGGNAGDKCFWICWKFSHMPGGLKAKLPPIRDVNRESGTASTNGALLRRLTCGASHEMRRSNAYIEINPIHKGEVRITTRWNIVVSGIADRFNFGMSHSRRSTYASAPTYWDPMNTVHASEQDNGMNKTKPKKNCKATTIAKISPTSRGVLCRRVSERAMAFIQELTVITQLQSHIDCQKFCRPFS
jgi:hypothetical protein